MAIDRPPTEAEKLEAAIPGRHRQTLGNAQKVHRDSGTVVLGCGNPFLWDDRHAVLKRRYSLEDPTDIRNYVRYLEAAVQANGRRERNAERSKRGSWMGIPRGTWSV